MVTDEQVSVLRARLRGDLAGAQRRVYNWDWAANRLGYTTLVSAAFVLAVERRFRPDGNFGNVEDVLKYIAEVRCRTPDIDDIDPHIAECLMLPTVTGADLEEIPVDEATGIELMLLTSLVADAQYDDTTLDAFIAEARELANDWMD